MRKLSKKSEHTVLNGREEIVLRELKLIYPLFGLKTSLKKININDENVTKEDIDIVTKFVDTFSTVSLHPAIVGDMVASIADQVNQHHHTKTCRKYKTICRFKFPKLPSYRTLIARPTRKGLSNDEKASLNKKHAAVIKKVKDALGNKELLNSILAKYPKSEEKTVEEAIEGRVKRIDALLESAGFVTKEEKQLYVDALEYSSSGCQVVMARDIDEVWVNSYNPEICRAWNGNTDFQVVLDFYAIITYITEYYTKDDAGD